MEVIHDRNNQEFKIQLDKSSTDKGFSLLIFQKYNQTYFAAYLTYVLNGDAIDFQHTFVPSKYRGQGIAEKLVLVKSCSFFRSNDNLILFFSGCFEFC